MASQVDSGGVVVEKPGWNVYTTLLLLSVLALIIGCVCLYMEMDAYEWDYNAKEAGRLSSWLKPAVQMVISPEADSAIV